MVGEKSQALSGATINSKRPNLVRLCCFFINNIFPNSIFIPHSRYKFFTVYDLLYHKIDIFLKAAYFFLKLMEVRKRIKIDSHGNFVSVLN